MVTQVEQFEQLITSKSIWNVTEGGFLKRFEFLLYPFPNVVKIRSIDLQNLDQEYQFQFELSYPNNNINLFIDGANYKIVNFSNDEIEMLINGVTVRLN